MRKTKMIKARVLAGILAAAMTVSTFGAVSTVFADEAVSMEEEAADEQMYYEEADEEAAEEAPDESYEEPDAAEEAEENGMDDDFDVEIPDTCEEGEDIEFPEECEEGVDNDAEEFPEEVDEEEAEETDLEDDDLLDEENDTAEADAIEDEAQQIRNVINDTVEANKDSCLYTTLNEIFYALCDAGIPVKEDNLQEIKDMIFESVQGVFDNTDEELHGAIDAAAERAREMGLLSVRMSNGSSSRSETDSWTEASKYFKPIFNGAIDAIGLAAPELKPFTPLLKVFGELFFPTQKTDRTDEILEELGNMESQINTATDNLKDHTYNVVALADIGDKFCTVKSKAATIRTIIQNTMDNKHLTDDEKLTEIANLYKDSEFRSLMSAMNGATDCFLRDTNDIFETNIFDAAYNRACQETMFSGEAIDVTMPYIMKQFAYYTAAYATMGEVFDAYEEVYGKESLKQSRREMAERMFGTDLDGNVTCDSIANVIANYFKRDRFIYVGKSDRTKIPVSKELRLVDGEKMVKACVKDQYSYQGWSRTPDYMAKSALTKAQLEDLAKYCEQKNLTLFDYLLNVLHFKYYTSFDEPFWMDFTWDGPNDPVWYHRGVYYLPSGSSVKGTFYLVTDKEISQTRSGDSCRMFYEGINANKVTSKEETVKVATGTLNYNLGIPYHTYYYNTPIFFQNR